MLALESPRWSELRHAYGSATNVPEILRRLASERRDPLRERAPGEARTHPDAWDDVFSCLCHQGTTYSSTYAALPHIVQLGESRLRQERVMHVVFAGAVAGRYGGEAVPDDLRDDYDRALERARAMALDLLRHGSARGPVLSHLLASLAHLDGHAALGNAIEGAGVDREISGECPACGDEVYVTPERGDLKVHGTMP
jgi:hypothetical protein